MFFLFFTHKFTRKEHCFIFITVGITCAHLEEKLKCMFMCTTETWVIFPGFLPNFHQLKAILTLFSAQSPWEPRTRKKIVKYIVREIVGLLEHITYTHSCNFFYKSGDYNNKYLHDSRYEAVGFRRFCGLSFSYYSTITHPPDVFRTYISFGWLHKMYNQQNRYKC